MKIRGFEGLKMQVQGFENEGFEVISNDFGSLHVCARRICFKHRLGTCDGAVDSSGVGERDTQLVDAFTMRRKVFVGC